MSGLRAGLIASFCLSMFLQDASAQPRGAAGDRDRGGILDRLGARRDERLNRNAPPPPAAGSPNATLNPNLTPNARGQGPANPPPSSRNRAPLSGPTPAPVPQSGPQSGQQRSANYPPSAGANTRLDNRSNPYSVAGSQAAPDTNLVPPATDVRPASATAPVNRLPYNGPGVLIRLPPTVPGEVNYLVDDSEHLIVHSGEDQLLRLKGSYEVRFSRGVTTEGHSYGEARYTITEGVYRFDVSANGWELYREGEARDVEPAVAAAQRRSDEMRRQDGPATTDEPPEEERNEPSDAFSPLSAPRQSKPADEDRAPDRRRLTPPPSPTPPATTEETLPAPKSILEPS